LGKTPRLNGFAKLNSPLFMIFAKESLKKSGLRNLFIIKEIANNRFLKDMNQVIFLSGWIL
jgi:hypothetical protein